MIILYRNRRKCLDSTTMILRVVISNHHSVTSTDCLPVKPAFGRHLMQTFAANITHVRSIIVLAPRSISLSTVRRPNSVITL